MVDGKFDGYSFMALAGFINSKLDFKGTLTFSTDSEYNFEFDTEHDIPDEGYLRVTLPKEMAFPQSMIDDQQIAYDISMGSAKIKFDKLTESTVSFYFAKGAKKKDNPIKLKLTGLRTPRSFRPSSEFNIATTTTEGYVVDQGGSDITVTMKEQNFIDGMQIRYLDGASGEIVPYEVTIDTFVHFKDSDKLFITLPPEVGTNPAGISCEAVEPPEGVLECSAEANKKTVTVQLVKLDKLDGQFKFVLNGMKNPGSTRPSSLFSDIHVETHDFYPIMKLESHEGLFIETDAPGRIKDFQLVQSTELFDFNSVYTISLTPFNPIGENGILTLKWTDQVVF